MLQGALEACEIDGWMEHAASRLIPGASLPAEVKALDDFMAARTFFVGYNLTLADLAIWYVPSCLLPTLPSQEKLQFSEH